ncbi:MAG: class I SAM-dependent methyltransferase [Anaerolineales bacterium]|nr:class I SAM-dependent methyltransferase [Anaerolineales bacterium]
MPGELTLLYHAHHSQFLEDIPFWRALASRQGPSALELGCGGGRVLLQLASAGLRMVGLDRDLEMLELLRRTAKAEGLARPNVFQADMAHFSLSRRFPLILMPCNTLSALPDDLRVPVFRRIAAHLSTRGIFAASLPNPFRLQELPPAGEPELEDQFSHPRTGNPVQVSSAWSKSGDRVEVRWNYDHLKPDGSVARLTAAVSHSLASLGRYESELRQAGLEPIEVSGDYKGRPFEPEAPYLVILTALKT